MKMMNTNFILSVNGKNADVRSLMFHFQKDPHPGGQTYQLVIRDADVVSEAMEEFGLGTHRQPEAFKQSSFLAYLFPLIGLKCGRTEFQFWANTIDEMDLLEGKLVLKGVCSPHATTSAK